MRVVKKEEAENTILAKAGRTSKISAMTSTLQVGEMLEIKTTDWKGKKPPYNIINRLAKKTGRKFIKGRLPDGSGWGVKRVA
jgi:hypothetical protein